MRWQEACLNSKFHEAARRTKDNLLMIRRLNSPEIVQVYGHPDKWREADFEDIEGFLDWEPSEYLSF